MPGGSLIAVWSADQNDRFRLYTSTYNPDLVPIKHYYAGGQRIATRVDDALSYLLADHLGSTTVVADAEGNEVGHVVYDPFGEIVERTLPPGVTDRLFTGQRYDSTMGLYDYNARFYDPQLGQFTQPDSIIPDPLNPAAWNRFSYVYNSPVNYTDPSGHCIWDGCLAEIAATGFIVGALTNVGATALQHDDPWGYLSSREAVIDFAVGGTFGATAAVLTPGIASLGLTLSAEQILLNQAIGFGLLNVAQGEIIAAAKQRFLGIESSQTVGKRIFSNFVFGIVAFGLAEGVEFGAKFISVKFSRYLLSQSPRFKAIAPEPLRKFIYLAGTRSYFTQIYSDATSPFGREILKEIEKPFMDKLGHSVIGNNLLISYGYGMGVKWGAKNILFNSNILPGLVPIGQ